MHCLITLITYLCCSCMQLNMPALCLSSYMLNYQLKIHPIAYLYAIKNKGGGKNDEQQRIPKRNTNQTHKKSTRHDHTTTNQPMLHAWLPNHNKNPKNLRHILRTQHRLPTPSKPRKKRLPQQQMEHHSRKTPQNIHHNNHRTKHTKIHRKLTKHHMQNTTHNNRKHTTNTHRNNPNNTLKTHKTNNNHHQPSPQSHNPNLLDILTYTIKFLKI